GVSTLNPRALAYLNQHYPEIAADPDEQRALALLSESDQLYAVNMIAGGGAESIREAKQHIEAVRLHQEPTPALVTSSEAQPEAPEPAKVVADDAAEAGVGPTVVTSAAPIQAEASRATHAEANGSDRRVEALINAIKALRTDSEMWNALDALSDQRIAW